MLPRWSVREKHKENYTPTYIRHVRSEIITNTVMSCDLKGLYFFRNAHDTRLDTRLERERAEGHVTESARGLRYTLTVYDKDKIR